MKNQKVSQNKTAKGLNTRDLLMQNTLALVAQGNSFSSLSLREVTKATGVAPAAFYRHFASMDELGHELVERSFEVLGTILIDLLSNDAVLQQDTKSFIKAYMDRLKDNIASLRLVITEYFGSSSTLKESVHKEVQILRSNIALEIPKIYPEKSLSRQDVMLLADICIEHAIICARRIILAYEVQGFSFDQDNKDLIILLATQLQIVLLGIHHWDNKR